MSRYADGATALGLAVVLFCIYNANGREIGNLDSQPTKYAARELLLRGTLTLNHVVGATPAFARRHTFVLAKDGRYRAANSPVPPIAAAIVAWPFVRLGAIDLSGPLAPAIVACVGASALTALAVAVGFLTARRYGSRRTALLVALGLGVGTGLWSTVSQTLWQHETAILGLSIAVYAFTVSPPTWRATLGAAAGLGLACASRPQLAPAVVVVLAGLVAAGGWRKGAAAFGLLAGAGAILISFNMRAYGHPLGAMPYLETLHLQLHRAPASFVFGWEGYAGLLLSPNRGLLVYSPIVAVAALGVTRAAASEWASPLRWLALAALAQFAFYGAYAVWWGGHTYGPRYMLDLLPLLVPSAAIGVERLRAHRVATAAACVALLWSVAVAGLGAFVYPAGLWNIDPTDVDRAHERLWDWRDTQIGRTMKTPPDPRNFMLFREGT